MFTLNMLLSCSKIENEFAHNDLSALKGRREDLARVPVMTLPRQSSRNTREGSVAAQLRSYPSRFLGPRENSVATRESTGSCESYRRHIGT